MPFWNCSENYIGVVCTIVVYIQDVRHAISTYNFEVLLFDIKPFFA